MRLTNPKIIKALEEGRCITSDKFPKHVFLKLKDKSMQLLDWGQNMDCEEFLYDNFLGLMKDTGLYICDDKGNMSKKEIDYIMENLENLKAKTIRKEWYSLGVVKNEKEARMLSRYILKDDGWECPVYGELTNNMIAQISGFSIDELEDIIERYNNMRDNKVFIAEQDCSGTDYYGDWNNCVIFYAVSKNLEDLIAKILSEYPISNIWVNGELARNKEMFGARDFHIKEVGCEKFSTKERNKITKESEFIIQNKDKEEELQKEKIAQECKEAEERKQKRIADIKDRLNDEEKRKFNEEYNKEIDSNMFKDIKPFDDVISSWTCEDIDLRPPQEKLLDEYETKLKNLNKGSKA